MFPPSEIRRPSPPAMSESAPLPDGVSRLIEPVERDIGAFSVRRVLPSAGQREIGPFVFFDQMGPAQLEPGVGLDVRPHPHIGLATLTWLFDGEIVHRDSLGSEQPIRPGAINWMTAGRGIVHSERSPFPREGRRPVFGLQVWIALPEEDAETAPAFEHIEAGRVPSVERDGVRIRLIAGRAFDLQASLRTYSETLYAELTLEPGASVTLPDVAAERAVYVVEPGLSLSGKAIAPATMAVLSPGATPVLSAQARARAVLIGGRPLAGRRRLWWNLVAYSDERMERAKTDWREGRFPKVPGDDEFIPLPES